MKMCILDQQNIIILNIQRSQVNKSSGKKRVLDWQLANRMSDKYIINAAYQKFNIDNRNNETHADIAIQSGMFEKCPNSSRFSIEFKNQGVNGKIGVYFK